MEFHRVSALSHIHLASSCHFERREATRKPSPGSSENLRTWVVPKINTPPSRGSAKNHFPNYNNKSFQLGVILISGQTLLVELLGINHQQDRIKSGVYKGHPQIPKLSCYKFTISHGFWYIIPFPSIVNTPLESMVLHWILWGPYEGYLILGGRDSSNQKKIDNDRHVFPNQLPD